MRTEAGQLWQARVMAGAASGDSTTGDVGTGDFAPANWLAVSAETDPDPAFGSELDLGGSTFREQATVSFTGSPVTAIVLTNLFNYAESGATIRKVGVFNAESGGSPLFVATVSEATVENGDSFNATYTITIAT